MNQESVKISSLSSQSNGHDLVHEPKLLLLVEYRLFDLSSLHQCCRQVLNNMLRALTEREKEVNGLHQMMDLLSRCLEEAKSLLGRRQTILDVSQFLNNCKVMLTGMMTVDN